MSKRIRTIAVAALLLGVSAVAIASNTQGQAFEHQAVVTKAGTAYAVEWQDSEPGKLRFLVEPGRDGAPVTASFSLFDGEREHLGTFQLDDDWYQVDRIVDGQERYTVVLHALSAGEFEILSQEDRQVAVEEIGLQATTVELLDGEHEDLAYQVSVDRDKTVAHMGIELTGAVNGLDVEAVTQDGETVLTSSAEQLVTPEGESLSATLTPEAFQAGSILVRIQAASFNGTLSMELFSFDQEPRQISTIAPDNDTEEDETEDNGTADNSTTAPETNTSTEWEAPIQGVVVTNLTAAEPVAFQVPAELNEVYIIGEDGHGSATLYGPDDTVLGTVEIDQESEGAVVWNEDEDTVAVPIATQGDGEHVILLRSAHEGLLFLPELEEATEHRTLELEAVEVELEETEEDTSLLVFRESTYEGNGALTSGLVAFDFSSRLLDTDTQVRIIGPEGEQVATAQGGLGTSFHDDLCPDGQGYHAAGPAGDYLVEMDSDGLLYGGDRTVTLVQYVR